MGHDDHRTTTVIDRFLETVRTGRVSPDLYADDARLDATVPGWRFQADGPVQIAAEYQQLVRLARACSRPSSGSRSRAARWCATSTPSRSAGSRTPPTTCTSSQVRGDQIVADTVFCGGRWGPEVLAQLGPAAHAG